MHRKNLSAKVEIQRSVEHEPEPEKSTIEVRRSLVRQDF